MLLYQSQLVQVPYANTCPDTAKSVMGHAWWFPVFRRAPMTPLLITIVIVSVCIMPASASDIAQAELLQEIFADMASILDPLVVDSPASGSGAAADRNLLAGSASGTLSGLPGLSLIPGLTTAQVHPGLDALLRSSAMPTDISSIYKAYSNDSTFRTNIGNNQDYQDYQGDQDPFAQNDPAFENINLDQAAIQAAALGVVTNSLQIPGGIVAVVASYIKLYINVVREGIAEWKLEADIGKLALDEETFLQKLYNDFNKDIDNSDYLGDAAKYIKLWNQLSAALNSGATAADMQGQVAQMEKATNILQSLVISPT